MNGILKRRPQVNRDLQAHFVYLGRRSLRTADRYLAAAEQTFQKILDMPGVSSLCESDNPHLADMRVRPIRGFKNYLVYFRITRTGVTIVRVLHAAQDIEKAFAPEP